MSELINDLHLKCKQYIIDIQGKILLYNINDKKAGNYNVN